MTTDGSGKREDEPRVTTFEHAANEAASDEKAQSKGSGADEAAGLYRLLVESVRDYAIFALDPNGYILSWNAGAERLKGYTTSEIVGRHFSIFYPREDIAARKPENELKTAIADGRVEDEGWRLRKDGTRFWANVVITALRDPSGKLVGFAKVTRDLTERRLAEQRAIADAYRVANSEEANKTKGNFLAAMSHELRTPLNAIGGYADLLLNGIGGTLSTQQRQYLARIQSSQQHLLGLVNDILNYSRVERGLLEYTIRPLSLQAVIDAVVPMIEPQAAKKSLVLTRRICRQPDVLGDRPKIEQILLNLLSNAVKFTPSGGSIEVECARVAACIELRVSDTGIGIPEEELSAIFQPFVQVGRSLTSTKEGAGLGLAISSDLAQGMNGELSVRSTEGAGSTFTLSLPAVAGR